MLKNKYFLSVLVGVIVAVSLFILSRYNYPWLFLLLLCPLIHVFMHSGHKH
ncbi:MAG: DUF2933 domain-containing protein [Bacillaceae bacterium]|nr:DUF2933 domain-containing protein [Bacillaceae bacterium]